MSAENAKFLSETAGTKQVDGVLQYASGGAPGMEMAEAPQDGGRVAGANEVAAEQDDLLMIQFSSFEGRAG